MDIQVLGPDGKPKTPVCDADGKLVVTGIAGGGGGSGDASAANQTTQIAQIGEVQANPTANTVLDRLKTLATLIGEVQASPTSNTLLDRVKNLSTLLSGGLPAALSAGGGVKVGLVDSLPAGTASIGAITSAQLPAALGSNGGMKVEANGAKSTASVSRVSASATAVTLLASNTTRRRVIIYNESTVALRVKLGSAASATDYSYLLGAGDTYESPTDWVYTGIVTGIWDSATGAAQVTEI